VDVTIRDARSADAEALLGIYRPVVTDSAASFELVPPSVAEFAQRIAIAQASWAWLVAERDGELAGYAYGSSYRSRAAYRWSVETSAYVHAAHRGRGVGTALYRELFGVLAARGYCQAYAGIVLPNDASVSLHRSLAFTPIGVFRRAGRKFGAWHDVSWWQRELREAPPAEP